MGGAFSRWLWAASTILAVGACASGYAFFTGQARIVRVAQTAPFEKLPHQIGEWKGEDLPILEQVKEKLTYDHALCRMYRDDLGHEIAVWIFYWEASSAIRGYHHPDVCYRNRGWDRVPEAKSHHSVELDQQRTLSITVRHYERARDRTRIAYWTQEGKHVWTDEDEASADKSGPGHNWIRDRLVENPPELSARISVLIASGVWGRSERGDRIVDKFSKQLAEHLYMICPWALPE